MPANEKVGERELELDGRKYVLRPSFEFMQAVESLTGRGTSELLMDINRGIPKATEIVQVLWLAADRNNKKVPAFGKFGELVSREIGIVNAGLIAGIMLQNGVLSDTQQAAVAEKIAAEEAALKEAEERSEDPDPKQPAEAESPSE
jgi:hypothetical protein